MKTKKTKVDNFYFVIVSPEQAKKLIWSKAITPIYELHEDDSESLICDVSEIKEDRKYGFELGFEDEIQFPLFEIHSDTAEFIREQNIFPLVEKNQKFYIEIER